MKAGLSAGFFVIASVRRFPPFLPRGAADQNVKKWFFTDCYTKT